MNLSANQYSPAPKLYILLWNVSTLSCHLIIIIPYPSHTHTPPPPSPSPHRPGLSASITAFSVGLEHTCVVLSAGGIMCWGDNLNGQLGIGSAAVYQSSPVAVTG